MSTPGPIGSVGHRSLARFFASEIYRTDSYFHLLGDVEFVDTIMDAVRGAHTCVCDCCKRICGVEYISMDDLCPECQKLARSGAFSKVWRPDAISDVSAKVMELFNDPQQLFEVKRELNIRIRWETHNHPKRLIMNDDVGIPKGWKNKPKRKCGKEKASRPRRSGRLPWVPIVA